MLKLVVMNGPIAIVVILILIQIRPIIVIIVVIVIIVILVLAALRTATQGLIFKLGLLKDVPL